MAIKIKIDPLDERSINHAIEMVSDYKNRIETKKKELIEALGSIGLSVLEVQFAHPYYAGLNDVKCDIEIVDDNKVVITARGEAVCFIEFGTGILFTNDPNPYAKELGFERGKYGKGKGSRLNGWTYYGEAGEGGASEPVPGRPGVYRTWGNGSLNAFPEAIERMLDMILVIAREVFR